jgi:hypothetical protein
MTIIVGAPDEVKKVPLVKPHLPKRRRQAAEEVTHAQLIISGLMWNVPCHELHNRLRSKEDVANHIGEDIVLVVAGVCHDGLNLHLHTHTHRKMNAKRMH